MNFNQQLLNQKLFLQNSINLFDKYELEAIRLATTIRVLVHDTRNSTSLLNHLKSKNISYYDSKSNKNNFSFFNISGKLNIEVNYEEFVKFTPYAGLVSKDILMFEDKLVMKYKPQFKQRDDLELINLVNFDSWWNGEIYDNRNGISLSRREIVLMASNKDGGAHVDNELPEGYESLKNDHFIELKVNYKKEIFENVPLYSSICQIGWELLKSLEKQM